MNTLRIDLSDPMIPRCRFFRGGTLDESYEGAVSNIR